MEFNRVVEMHSHMFNGYYLPLEEIFDHKFRLSRATAIVLANLIKNNIGKKNVLNGYDDRSWLQLANQPGNTDRFADALTLQIKLQLNEETDRIKGDPSQISDAAAKLISNLAGLFETSGKADNLSLPRFRQKLTESLLKREDEADEQERLLFFEDLFERRLLDLLREISQRFSGSMEFLGKMMVSDESLADELLRKIYSPNHRPALTIHHTMDIEAAYFQVNASQGQETLPPAYPFYEKQIQKSSKFIKRAHGRLLGFVAFHPERGLEGKDDCLKALKQGHIGIKIYPPLNYRPDGQGMPSNELHRAVPDYTEVLTALYTGSHDKIPLLTHCTPQGFEAWDGTGPLSNPLYWENVLNKHNDLRLCFGHAGGGIYEYEDAYQGGQEIKTDGWYTQPAEWAESNNNYARQIAGLCRTYPNVYADFSYLQAMLYDDDKQSRFTANLRYEFDQQGKYHLADKLVYGSDWHMAMLIDKCNEFIAMFKDIMIKVYEDEAQGRELCDRFFFRNAVRFLNLPEFIKNNTAFFDADSIDYLNSIEQSAQG